MSTKTDKRKTKKKVERKKRLARERNVSHNRPNYRYELQVYYEEQWSVAKRFRTAGEVQAHLVETEALRRQGDTEIIEGKVYLMTSMREVAHIKPFKPEEKGPTMAEVKAMPELASVKESQ